MLDRFRNFFKSAFQNLQESEIQLLAVSMAYTTVFSIVPMLAISVSVFKALGGVDKFLNQLQPWAISYLTPGTSEQLVMSIEKTVKRVNVGTLGIFGVSLLMIAATKLFYDMERAIQRVWGERRPRHFWKRIFWYWAAILIGPVTAAIILGVMSSKHMMLRNLVPHKMTSFFLIFAALAMVYKFVPYCKVKWRPTLVCAAFAAAGIIGAQSIYATITKNMLFYNRIYGSMASIPIFLLWIQIIWLIVLLGASLNATFQKST